MVKAKERLLWLDAIKLFAIIMVVWGHLIPKVGFLTPEPISIRFYGINGFIYSFHMPLFMTMSGFVSYKIKQSGGGIFRKFKQLIVPCITVAIIGPLINFHDDLWYLRSLFACYAICVLYYKVDCKYKLPISLLLFFILCPLLTRIPFLFRLKIDFMLPFFVLGLFLHEKYSIIKKHLNSFLICFGVLFLICILFWSGRYVWYNSRANWIDYYVLFENFDFHKYMLNHSNDIHEFGFLSFHNLLASFFRFVTGCFASIFFMCLFIRIFETFKYAKLAALGQYSLHVYILHKLFVNSHFLRDVFLHYGITPSNDRYVYIFATLIVAIIITYVCIVIGRVLERNRYIGFLLFGKS